MRKILRGIVLGGSICCLCACGNQNIEEVEVQNVKQSAIQSESENIGIEYNNIVDSLPSYIPGLYIGENGSGLIIYSEGKADYYWYGWDSVETGDIWHYENNKLTIYMPSCQCDVYAEIPEEVTSTLVFKSNSSNWNEESFIGYEIGKINFSFPENYMYEVINESTGEYVFAVADEMEEPSEAAIIRTYCEDYDHDNEYFYIYVDGYTDSILNKIVTDMTFIKSENTKVANQSAKRYLYSLVKDDGEMQIDVIAINNMDSKKIVYLIKIYLGVIGSDNFNKYYSEFDRVLDSATLSGTSTNTENIKIEVDEVTPELKEFLDGYETFINEYIDFMKKYSSASSNDTITMLSDYLDIMARYAEFVDEIDKYDTNTMSTADVAYYLDVTNRCTKKMLEIY